MPHVSQYSNVDMERIVAEIEARDLISVDRACEKAGITATTFYRWKDKLAKSLPRVSRKSSRPKHAQPTPMPAGAAGVGEIPVVIVEDLILQQIVSGNPGALIERFDAELTRLRADIEQKQEAVKRIEAFRKMLAPAEKGASG